MPKREIFYQNNPNSANYDSNIPAGYGYWETVGDEENEPEEDIPDENYEE